MNHIIFDFDGVLANTFHFHLNNINTLYDVGITADEYKDMHNRNFYAAPLEKMRNFKKDEYPDLVAEAQSQLPLLPEAGEALEYFSKKYKLHIISSGWERQIRPFLKYHHIESYFSEVLCADHGVSKSEKFNTLFAEQKIKPAACLFITDTLGDIREAETVGVTTIAVTFGFHSQEVLEQGNPTYIAHSWAEIQKIVGHFFTTPTA